MKQPMIDLVHVTLKDSTCDTLTKMLIGYVLNMPHSEKFYHEKVTCVVEFMEEAMPQHPGALAMYFKILDLMPATVKRAVPAPLLNYAEQVREEVEKYYGDKLPSKYFPSKIITPDKTLVDANGMPLTGEAPKLQLL